MKNKKLLTRLFALLASLVLVLALALPCFADETEQPPTDYIYKRVYGYDDLVSYFSVVSFASCIIRESTDTQTYFFGEVFFNRSQGFFNISWKDIAYPDEYVYLISSTDNNDSLVYKVDIYPIDGDASSDSYSITWDDIELYILVPVSSASIDPTTPSSDMYSNLFNILKDAVYGSDAELTGSQEYALTLISTILTYATILLPVILVIFIAVWCFKRF